MPKIKLKNSYDNTLLNLIKETDMNYSSLKVFRGLNGAGERIKLFPKNERDRNGLKKIIDNYGTQLYHDATIVAEAKVDNIYNYSSNQYENLTSNLEEANLPLYYIEETNNQNAQYSELKSLEVDTITRKYIMNIANLQTTISPKLPFELAKFKNIVIDSSYVKSRSKSALDEFCYYNKIEIASSPLAKNNLLHTISTIGFQSQTLGAILGDNNIANVPFIINDLEEATVPVQVQDLQSIVQGGMFTINLDDKIILGERAHLRNPIFNTFKKILLNNKIEELAKKETKTLSQMIKGEECNFEFMVYKVDKFIDLSTVPIQSFWLYDDELKEFYDFQVKQGQTYRYELKAYTIIYGNSTRIKSGYVEDEEGLTIEFLSNPSFKIALIDYETNFVKVVPKLLLPPFVSFINESSNENYIKIYLDLKNSSKKDKFIEITNEDAELLENIPMDDRGDFDFDYQMQDGVFEVYRLPEMPKTYQDFRNAKTIDVKNMHSSTSVVFRDFLMPNKKYYYIFRAINLVGLPSNPTPVYEVELLRDSQKSKIVWRAVTLEKEKIHNDKTFKNLLQIKPAFQQEVFDDQADEVVELESFEQQMNNLSLGTAADRVWGKKFKIRVKSKDTGKIVDLNIKFNLIKDNI